MNNMSGKEVKRANPVSIQRILYPLSASLGLSSDIRLEQLLKNWQEVVGAANAAHTRPAALKNGVLTVLVSSPAWMTQVRFLSPIFLKKINSFDPRDDVKISEIRFVLEWS